MKSRIMLSLVCFLATMIGRAAAQAPSGPTAIGAKMEPAEQGAIRSIDGPTPQIPAFASGAPAAVTLTPTTPLDQHGGVMFWFHTDRTYSSGNHVEPYKHTLLEASDAFALIFRNDDRSTTLEWRWDKTAHSAPIAIELPSLKGPQWHHVAFWWDAEKGTFEGRLNGSPLRIPGTTVAA